MSLYSKINCKAYSATLAQYLDYSDRGRNRLDVDYYIPAGALINCDGYNADGTLINPVYQQTTMAHTPSLTTVVLTVVLV